MIYGRSFNSFWKLCLAITALSFGVQFIPLVGLISHLFLTPWWPTLFLNAAFVLMAADALWGSRDRRLFVAPIIWFGGYAIVAGFSHTQFYIMNHAANKMNEQILPQWTKDAHSLRVINGSSDSQYASDLRSEHLIRNYDIDEVFNEGNASTRLKRESCPGSMGVDIINGVNYSRIWRGGGLSQEPMQYANGICMVSGPATPLSNIVSVTAREIEYRQGLVEGITQDFDVVIPGRVPFTLRSVTIAPLPWIPRPVAGCHFKGGFGDSWDNGCHAYFGHPSWRQYDSTPLKVITHSLGLKAATIQERMPDLMWISSGR